MAAFRRLALRERRLGTLACEAGLRLLNGPPYRRHEAVETLLEQVVGRADVQALHRLFLDHRAGHEDDGHVRLRRLRLLQRGDPVVAGQVVVGDDEIEGFLRSARLRSVSLPVTRRMSHDTPSISSLCRTISASRGLSSK